MMIKQCFSVSSLALIALAAFFTACTWPGPGGKEFSSKNNAQSTMENVAINVNRCWFKSGDKAFKDYHLAPELNSYSGRPRILVVPARNPEERPLLVIEAQGDPAKVSLYGILMEQSEGNRIAKDVNRWVKGDKDC